MAVGQDGSDLHIRGALKAFLEGESRRLPVGISCYLALSRLDLPLNSVLDIPESA